MNNKITMAQIGALNELPDEYKMFIRKLYGHFYAVPKDLATKIIGRNKKGFYQGLYDIIGSRWAKDERQAGIDKVIGGSL